MTQPILPIKSYSLSTLYNYVQFDLGIKDMDVTHNTAAHLDLR